MYKCHSCGKQFLHDEVAVVDHGGPEEYWGAIVHREELTDSCPYCFSDDIEEGGDDIDETEDN